jgi:outer membrane protein assembly factor BamB
VSLSRWRTMAALLAALALGLLLGRGLGRPDAGGPDAVTRRMLESLGYSGWGEGTAGRGAGVVRLDAARAVPGFNLYTSAPLARAELLALDGTPVHTWADPDPRAKGWDHVVLGPDGDLYAINGNGVLERWSRDSRRLWRREIDAHHDLAFDLDGDPVVLVRRRTEFRRNGRTLPVVDDCLVTLDPRNGAERRRLCLAPHLAERIDAGRADAIARELDAKPDPQDWNPKVLDAFHTNSIVFLDRDVPGLGRRGDALLSVRQMNALVVIDPADGELRWWWGPGDLQHQHHATLLDDDRVLVFDNGRRRRWSRVLEVDPATGAITWRYGEAEGQRFFSAKRGASQRLPGGNVLVTDSESGRAFEVTREGDVVFEFANPHVYEDRRAAIYRMVRIPPERQLKGQSP